MSESTQLAAIAALMVVVQFILNRWSKREDYRRADIVSDRVEATARQTEAAAKLLLEAQKETIIRTDKVAATAAQTAIGILAKTDTILDNTIKIHGLTNSTNSNLQKALELMTEKFANSERSLAQAIATSKEIAAQHVLTDLQVAVALRSPAPVEAGLTNGDVGKSLENIDDQTKGIEKNTKKTGAIVEQLKKE